MATEAEKAYEFRPYIQDDLNFIRSSWASSFYKGTTYQDILSPDEFHSHHRPIRDRILDKPEVAIIVCVSKDSTDLIIGWILVEVPKTSPGLILHYLYVKQAFKGEGIAKELVQMACPKRPVLMTHLTEKAQRIMSRSKASYPQFFYTPHLI